jgi:hypothetical protein
MNSDRLQTPKRRSKSHLNHSWRQLDQVQRGRVDKNGRPDHIENALEQRVKHRWGAVHVFGHQNFLPHRGPQLLRIHENAYIRFSRMDQEAEQPQETHSQRFRLPEDDGRYGDSRRRGYWPINFFAKGLHPMDITSASIRRDCGDTNGAPSPSPPRGGQFWGEICG